MLMGVRVSNVKLLHRTQQFYNKKTFLLTITDWVKNKANAVGFQGKRCDQQGVCQVIISVEMNKET